MNSDPTISHDIANAQEESFMAFIPTHILDDKTLDEGAKFLLLRINALTRKCGYCWASDKYLSELLGVSTREIKSRLKALEDRGYIIRETNRKPDGLTWDRKIFSNYNYEGHHRSLRGAPPFPSEGSGVPYTSRLNTSREEYTPPPKKQPPAPSPEAQEVCDFLLSHIKEVNPKFKPKSPKEWFKAAELLLEDNTIEQLKTIIVWTFKEEEVPIESDWSGWKTVIQSPAGLLKNLDMIAAKMKAHKAKKKDSSANNRQYAQEIATKFNAGARQRGLEIHAGPNQIEFIGTRGQNAPVCIEYKNPRFQELSDEQIKKWRLQ